MIRHANVEFNDSGTPVAQDFDDVYFSNDDGLLESDFVFLQQNNLLPRWQSHPRRHFVIAETGFGTGLNFLNTWQRFISQNQKSVEQLHFISFEKFPLQPQVLAKAHAAWPELGKLSQQLIDQYPEALAGCHRLEFDGGKIILDLWFGDIGETLPQLCYSEKGVIDAWYLDGFAPSKNPEMWQQSLFNQMADLARQECTFATFTAAGFVRRGLINAGFEVKKVKGYGRKREMLIGHLPETNSTSSQQPYFERSAQSLNNIAIIGGGIASATLAYSFAKRGISTTLFCKDTSLAMGASHNHQGAIYPNLQADFNATSEFFAHSFYYAKRALMQLDKDGFHFPHDWCGVLLHAISETKSEIQQRLIRKKAWPSSLIRAVDQQQSYKIAGIELPYAGLYIQQAGWVNPPALVDAYWNASKQKHTQNVELNCEIKEFYKTDGGYILIKTDGSELGPFSQVIVTCGELSARFTQTSDIPLQPARGQVSEVSENSLSANLKTVLCHKGYFTPALDGLHSMGATFEKNSFDRTATPQGDITNYEQLTKFYPSQLGIKQSDVVNAKAAIRATTPDHQPIVGQVPEQNSLVDCFAPLRKGKFYNFKHYQNPHSGLYIFSGLGARGLCTAPLAAETLVAELCGEPLPVPNHISELLHPNRFIIRNLKRNKL